MKGDSCSFSHDKLVQVDLYGGQRRRGRSSSPAPNSKAKTDEGREKSSRTSGNREESSSDKRSKIPCRHKNCKKKHHVNFGILWCVKTTNLRLDAHMEENVSSDMLKPRRSPAKKSKDDGAKGSVALLKESTQLGCVSQDSYPRKSILRKRGKLGSENAVKFSKSTWHNIKKIRERKGPSREIIQKCERSPCATKFEERSHEETLHQDKCAHRSCSRMRKKTRFTLLLKQEKSRGARIRSRSRSINAHAEQK